MQALMKVEEVDEIRNVPCNSAGSRRSFMYVLFSSFPTALKRLKAAGTYTESEEEDAPKHIICMNLSCPKYHGTGHCEHSYTKKYIEEDRDTDIETREQEMDNKEIDSFVKKNEEADRKVGDKEAGDRRESENKTDDEQMKVISSIFCL